MTVSESVNLAWQSCLFSWQTGDLVWLKLHVFKLQQWEFIEFTRICDKKIVYCHSPLLQLSWFGPLAECCTGKSPIVSKRCRWSRMWCWKEKLSQLVKFWQALKVKVELIISTVSMLLFRINPRGGKKYFKLFRLQNCQKTR